MYQVTGKQGNKMKHTEQLPLWYVMAARTPLFLEVLPRLMRQSLVLLGDLLNLHFHFVKTWASCWSHFCLENRRIGEQEKWCCSLDKNPISSKKKTKQTKNPNILKSPPEACPRSLLAVEEEIKTKPWQHLVLFSSVSSRGCNCCAIFFQASVKTTENLCQPQVLNC